MSDHVLLIRLPNLKVVLYIGGSGQFFLIALSLQCWSRWMQLENRRKTIVAALFTCLAAKIMISKFKFSATASNYKALP